MTRKQVEKTALETLTSFENINPQGLDIYQVVVADNYNEVLLMDFLMAFLRKLSQKNN